MKDERIKYIDLLYSIYVSLKKEFKDATVSMKESGEEIKGPYFFVQIRPRTPEAYRFYDKEFVNVTITYGDVVLDQEKQLIKQDELTSLFDLGIEVNGAFIMFEDKDFSYGDGFINLNFSLNYFNEKHDRSIYLDDRYTEMLKELDMDFYINGKEKKYGED